MYDVIGQSKRIGDIHRQQYHHSRLQSAVNHNTAYHSTSFCRADPHQAYSLYGVYAADVMIGSTCGRPNTRSPVLPTAGIYGHNFAPVSPGSYWADNIMQAKHAKWSKPVIHWDQRQCMLQYGCPTSTDVAGAYRHGPVMSASSVASTLTGVSGLAAASSLSRCSSPISHDSSSLASLQRQKHCTASTVACVVDADDDNDDDDVETLTCGIPASPHSATYQPHSANANSNALYTFCISLKLLVYVAAPYTSSSIRTIVLCLSVPVHVQM